jgi:hypothetical protein
VSRGKQSLDLGFNELRIGGVDAGSRHTSPKGRSDPEARARNAGRIGLDVLGREIDVSRPTITVALALIAPSARLCSPPKPGVAPTSRTA